MNTYFFEKYEVTELSYSEYKNLVKNLFTQDVRILNKTFNKIFENNVKDGEYLNIQEKIKILFFIRALTLGENVSLSVKEKTYNIDTNDLINNLNISYEGDSIEIDNFTLNNINSFFVEDINDEIKKNLTHIKIDDNKKLVSKFTYEEKGKLIDEMSEGNLSKIISQLIQSLNKNHLKILDMNLNLHNGEILNFFKAIFDISLNELYNLEYFLIKNLNLNSDDFKNYSFSELKILMNKVVEDYEKENDNEKNNAGNSQK